MVCKDITETPYSQLLLLAWQEVCMVSLKVFYKILKLTWWQFILAPKDLNSYKKLRCQLRQAKKGSASRNCHIYFMPDNSWPSGNSLLMLLFETTSTWLCIYIKTFFYIILISKLFCHCSTFWLNSFNLLHGLLLFLQYANWYKFVLRLET